MEHAQHVIGCRVQLRLIGSEDNGRQGICLPQELMSKDQVVVRLDDGKEITVKPENVMGAFRCTPLENRGVGVVADFPIEAGTDLIYEQPVLKGEQIGQWRYTLCTAGGRTAWFLGCCFRAWLGLCLVRWLGPSITESTGINLYWEIWGSLLGSCFPTRFTEGQLRWMGCILGSYLGSWFGASAGGFLNGVATGFTKEDVGSAAGVLAGATSLKKQFKDLPIETQASVMALHDSSRWFRSLQGIFCLNSMPTGAALGEVVLCLWISRFNHSCRPNAIVQWNEDQGVQVLRAIKPIELDEEICISYLGEDIMEPRKVRLEKLRSSFGFQCWCASCKKADPESDERLEEVSELMKPPVKTASGNLRNPLEDLIRLERALELLETEGFTDPNAWIQILTIGLHLAVDLGSQLHVQKWAGKARDRFGDTYGRKDVRSQLLKDFADRPPLCREELVSRGWILGAN